MFFTHTHTHTHSFEHNRANNSYYLRNKSFFKIPTLWKDFKHYYAMSSINQGFIFLTTSFIRKQIAKISHLHRPRYQLHEFEYSSHSFQPMVWSWAEACDPFRSSYSILMHLHKVPSANSNTLTTHISSMLKSPPSLSHCYRTTYRSLSLLFPISFSCTLVLYFSIKSQDVLFLIFGSLEQTLYTRILQKPSDHTLKQGRNRDNRMLQ